MPSCHGSGIFYDYRTILLNFSNANGAWVFPLKYIQLTNLIHFDLSKI